MFDNSGRSSSIAAAAPTDTLLLLSNTTATVTATSVNNNNNSNNNKNTLANTVNNKLKTTSSSTTASPSLLPSSSSVSRPSTSPSSYAYISPMLHTALSRTVTVYAFMLLLSSAYLLQNATCMSLDRIGIDRNELQNEQQQPIDAGGLSDRNTDVIVDDDMELKAVPAAGGATDAFMLLPAGLGTTLGGVEQQAAVNENVYDANKSTEENNAMESGSDMLMMETHVSPVVVELPAENVQALKPDTAAINAEDDTSKELKKTETEKRGEINEMLPLPQALDGSTLANAEAGVDMFVVPPAAQSEATEHVQAEAEVEAEALPMPEALVGSPAAATAAAATLTDITALNEVEQADDEKAEEEQLQQDDEKSEELPLRPHEEKDDEKIPFEQKVDEEPEKSLESSETLAELVADLSGSPAENDEAPIADNVDVAKVDHLIADEVKTESESAPQQSVFGAFADAVEAVEDEIVAAATADEKLPEAPIETKQPDLLQSVEKDEEADKKPEQSVEEQQPQLVESAEREVAEDSDVAIAIEHNHDEEVEELNGTDNNKLAISDEGEQQPEQQNESVAPAKSEVIAEEAEAEVDTKAEAEAVAAMNAESTSESANENANEISADVPEEPAKIVLPSESAESIKAKEKPEQEAVKVETEADVEDTPQLPASASSEKIHSDEIIKAELEAEKIGLPAETDNKDEVKPVEDHREDEVAANDDKKDEVEQLQDSVEEELVAEIPVSAEEQLHTGEKQTETIADEDSEENAFANEIVEDHQAAVQQDELPTDERMDEIIKAPITAEESIAKGEEAEKEESVPVVEDIKAQEENVENSEQHKDEIVEESEVVEQTDVSDEDKDEVTDDNKEEKQELEANSIVNQQQTPVDQNVETKEEAAQKIDMPVEDTEEPHTPQIVELTSDETEKQTADEAKVEETKEDIAEKIDVSVEEVDPQIVEMTSDEMEKQPAEEQKDDEEKEAAAAETQKLESTEETEQSEKQEAVILADVPEQPPQQLAEAEVGDEHAAIEAEIADTIDTSKDNLETNIPTEQHKEEKQQEEEIAVAQMENDTVAADTEHSNSVAVEMQPQTPPEKQALGDVEEEEEEQKVVVEEVETPAVEAKPVQAAPPAPAETDATDSMLTTIIQAPQPQQEEPIAADTDSDVDDMNESTIHTDNVAEATDVNAAEAATQTLINEENNAQAQTEVEAEADVAQPIESAEVVAQQAALPATSTHQQQSVLAPLNVVDSVLNYVNASFIQLQQQQLESNKLQDDNTQQQQNIAAASITAMKDEEAAATTTFNSQLRRYDGAQVWRIVVQNDKDRRMADELQTKYGGQLWKEVKQEVDYLLKPQVLTDAAQHVRAANLSRIVLIDNLQKVIEVENPPEDEILLLQNRKGHPLTWQAYHRLDDIHAFLDYMAKTYPDICAVETIGYSVEKRPLKILKISNGNANNPGIWIDGGTHAREWIGPATVTYIVNQLVEGWDDLPAYMRQINWYVHPMVNPDGYEYSHTTDRLWRKNMRSHGRQCPGVDLNRNFGYKWGGKGTSANPCSQTYRGSKAFSEPETFYISKYISNAPRNTFQAFLTFHSYGQYILYPWGYDYGVSADRADLDRVARQAGTSITKSSGGKYTVGPSALTLYPAAGGADDWAKGIAGIKYTYTVEMGDTGRFGFVLPANYIEPNGRDGYTFVETVARAITLGRSTERRRRF